MKGPVRIHFEYQEDLFFFVEYTQNCAMSAKDWLAPRLTLCFRAARTVTLGTAAYTIAAEEDAKDMCNADAYNAHIVSKNILPWHSSGPTAASLHLGTGQEPRGGRAHAGVEAEEPAQRDRDGLARDARLLPWRLDYVWHRQGRLRRVVSGLEARNAGLFTCHLHSATFTIHLHLVQFCAKPHPVRSPFHARGAQSSVRRCCSCCCCCCSCCWSASLARLSSAASISAAATLTSREYI